MPNEPDIIGTVERSGEGGDVSAVSSEQSIEGNHGDEEESQEESETEPVEHISSSNRWERKETQVRGFTVALACEG